MQHLGTMRLLDAAASGPALTIAEAQHLQACDECRDQFVVFVRQYIAMEELRRKRDRAKRSGRRAL